LPPAISGINYTTVAGNLTASWTTLPSYDYVFLDVFASSSVVDYSERYAKFSKGWLAAHNGVTDIAFDASAPGYDPSWAIDTSGPYVRHFGIEQESGSITYDSLMKDGVNGASARVLMPHSRPQGCRHARQAARCCKSVTD